jgi:hypothetical protein
VKETLQSEERAVADIVQRIERQVDAVIAKLKRRTPQSHGTPLCAPVEYQSKTA